MSEAKRLIDELSRVVDGDPWYGDSIATILDGVTVAAAVTRPLPGAHSIWELVRHMTAWTAEAQRRLAGHPAGDPQAGDWPPPDGTDDAAWRADVAAFFSAHSRLVDSLASYSNNALLEPTNDPRNRALGTGVSKDVMLHGLAQHHAYHGGQISLLKKLAG